MRNLGCALAVAGLIASCGGHVASEKLPSGGGQPADDAGAAVDVVPNPVTTVDSSPALTLDSGLTIGPDSSEDAAVDAKPGGHLIWPDASKAP